ARPGHFVGVATVVVKLFAIVDPDASFFGQKDFQQLRVLQTVARDLRLRTRVIGCPIVRERDGLAMSSRNAYLDETQRRDALALSGALTAAEELWRKGTRDPDTLRARMRERLDVRGINVEYASAADPVALAELRAPAERAVLSIAARVGNARLIDNALLGMEVDELS
ncbi:MAG TPA: pantoate--beta-alanine ligase, partial [Candidatus Limnocylindrales bacterium]|nr:pantoate--beta-alanine ligase [Candidatus Limnocylindrales bacterium]